MQRGKLTGTIFGLPFRTRPQLARSRQLALQHLSPAEDTLNIRETSGIHLQELVSRGPPAESYKLD